MAILSIFHTFVPMNPLKTMIVAALLAFESAPIMAQTIEENFIKYGFVDVATLSPSIKVDLMYGKADNFTGVVLYDGIDKAYLHPEAAHAVAKAQEELHKLFPEYNLLIKDASRPMSVQTKMYRVVQGGPKAKYVSNPKNGGGLHNYGLAVDITIADADGKELPMGTPVDHLGVEANIDRELELVKAGKLTETERQNRLLLRCVMKAGGFTPLRTEWWHFNLVSRAVAKSRYRRLDF